MSLRVRKLRIGFGERTVVSIDELEVGDGEIVGLVGESGSGKSMTALAIIGLARSAGAWVEGSIELDGRELTSLDETQWRALRGDRIAMIFQSPVSSLNPVFRVGDLFVRALRLHGESKAGAHERAARAMREVVLPPDLLRRYPHQLSGGQAQRVAIAMAVALRARVLLADEPTSALDVTVQAEILELIQRMRREEGISVLFVSHDLAVVAGLCDQVAIMQAGRIVETGPTGPTLREPSHPYTQALVAAIPRLRGAHA
jgi:ABC-type glutathione transport system ATPase component